jgi:hypothetical protein
VPKTILRPMNLRTLAPWLLVGGVLLGSCKKSGPPPDQPPGQPVLAARLTNSQFNVADAMLAAIQMQISGEPFAQLLGYDLAGFVRTLAIPDQYTDPATNQRRTDTLGYSLAIETYEYSKQPMNNLSFEAGAGLSLMFGPLLNPTGQTGDPAYNLLANRFQQFAAASQSGGPLGTNLIVSPAPSDNPFNYYGWPGLQPVFAEFARFDPTIDAAPGFDPLCTFGGSPGALGYGGNPNAPPKVSNYECDYNTLNLPRRDAQVAKRIEPEALGYSAWKQGLWSITYWQTMQDTSANPIVDVAPADRPNVGQPGNTVVGKYADPNTGQLVDGDPGVYLGDIPLEGWQGLLMMEEIDNKAALLLGSLLSPDGTRLQGAPSLQAAINYSYDSPLLYFPAAVSVTETPTTTDPALVNKYFPQPTSFTVADGTSQLRSLNGLLGGYSEAFAMTDRNNADVGGSVPFDVTFDGDPFPRDNGRPDGESTLHDRALGILKIALVNLDRLHFDPTAKVLVDSVSVAGGTPTRGSRVSTVDLATSITALRTAYRSLNSSLQLYSNDTPDTHGAPGALASVPLTGASYTGTLEDHLTELIRAQAEFLSNKLISPTGVVANGYDLRTNAADASPSTLVAEAAAIFGLLDAYLATSDQKYRTRALDVYADLEARFWIKDARIYRTTAGVDNLMKYTPLGFGLLHGALRQYYKLVASAPSRKDEGDELLRRLTRMNKIVLNGWDDRNKDDIVQYPFECLEGRLQMGERALTGEFGAQADRGDRDRDCVPEISTVHLPAALGAELEIQLQRQ